MGIAWVYAWGTPIVQGIGAEWNIRILEYFWSQNVQNSASIFLRFEYQSKLKYRSAKTSSTLKSCDTIQNSYGPWLEVLLPMWQGHPISKQSLYFFLNSTSNELWQTIFTVVISTSSKKQFSHGISYLVITFSIVWKLPKADEDFERHIKKLCHDFVLVNINHSNSNKIHFFQALEITPIVAKLKWEVCINFVKFACKSGLIALLKESSLQKSPLVLLVFLKDLQKLRRTKKIRSKAQFLRKL